MEVKPLNLSNIQGNIFGGFNKDYQDFLFVRFRSRAGGRAWIREMMDPRFEAGVAHSTSENVLKFNAQYRALRAEGVHKPEEIISSQWTNLGLSFRGLQALGIAGIESFPMAFRDGMAARKNVTGDLSASDPSRWRAPFNSGPVHAVVLVAADSETTVDKHVGMILQSSSFKAGVDLIDKVVQGRVRQDQPGHEHFGFKDGISQPGIRGIDRPDDAMANPDQGHPGQDLLWPGEFVLGYPTQIPTPDPVAQTARFNTKPGPISQSGPAWTVDGSYLVFRRLAQDVYGFREHVKQLAVAHGISEDLMAAKLVGRFKSGCPLVTPQFQQPPRDDPRWRVDPGRLRPLLHQSSVLNNNFEFGDDPAGNVCPLSAHIRKAYPRDAAMTKDGTSNESMVQTHRLLRRGIPFGESFVEDKADSKDQPRGLLFLAYQRDIADQFEFVQRLWINEEKFPPYPRNIVPGEDPLITQTESGTYHLDATKPNIMVKHFVNTTGGEYFFAPSIETLRGIGSGTI